MIDRDDDRLTNDMWKFESLIKKLVGWNNLVYIAFQVDYKMNKREYTFRLKNIYWKMVVPDKVSALIHIHKHAYNISYIVSI